MTNPLSSNQLINKKAEKAVGVNPLVADMMDCEDDDSSDTESYSSAPQLNLIADYYISSESQSDTETCLLTTNEAPDTSLFAHKELISSGSSKSSDETIVINSPKTSNEMISAKNVRNKSPKNKSLQNGHIHDLDTNNSRVEINLNPVASTSRTSSCSSSASASMSMCSNALSSHHTKSKMCSSSTSSSTSQEAVNHIPDYIKRKILSAPYCIQMNRSHLPVRQSKRLRLEDEESTISSNAEWENIDGSIYDCKVSRCGKSHEERKSLLAEVKNLPFKKSINEDGVCYYFNPNGSKELEGMMRIDPNCTKGTRVNGECYATFNLIYGELRLVAENGKQRKKVEVGNEITIPPHTRYELTNSSNEDAYVHFLLTKSW